MSFENFPVLSELELAMNPADIFGMQCLEAFGRVTSVIKSTKQELRVNVVAPANPIGTTACFFFRKETAGKRAEVELDYEDASLPVMLSVKPAAALVAGGSVVRLDVERFPLLRTGTAGVADVLVLFGSAEAEVLTVVTATPSSTVLLVAVPKGAPLLLGAVSLPNPSPSPSPNPKP